MPPLSISLHDALRACEIKRCRQLIRCTAIDSDLGDVRAPWQLTHSYFRAFTRGRLSPAPRFTRQLLSTICVVNARLKQRSNLTVKSPSKATNYI